MSKQEQSGKSKGEMMGGLKVFRHEDYIEKVATLPEGTDELVMAAIRRNIGVFRKYYAHTPPSKLIVALIDAHFCPGYAGTPFEVLCGSFTQFCLLDIRMGGFSKEELDEYEKILKGKG